MQLATQLQLLQSQLNIPSDKHNYIIPALCNNFVRKYQKNISINVNQLTQQFKYVLQQIDIYSQYTFQAISKYQSLNKLQVLVRSIIQGQMSILVYFGNVVDQTLRQRNKYQQKLQNISCKAHERCRNCSKPLKLAQIQTIKDQIGLKFKDPYSYFTHEIDQINKLSEQASLIFRKKILNIEGIGEEEYMYKLQKVKENISTNIQHVTCSLNKITLFQQKFAELQQYQYMLTRNQKQKFNQDKFDSKKYMVDLSKIFYNSIKKLQQKLNCIKSFFIITVTRQTQTKSQFNQCTPQKLEQLKDALTKSEIERRQIQIYMSSADQQLAQTKQKLRNCEDKLYITKQEKQKLNEKYKILEIQLQKHKEYLKTVQKKSQKKLQINNTQKKKKQIISSKINNELNNIKNSFIQKNKINSQQLKQIQNIQNQNTKKQQKKSGISKKYQNNSFNPKNQIPPFQQTQINLLSPHLQKSKIDADELFRSEQNDLSKSKLLLSQKSLLRQPRLQQNDLLRNKHYIQKQQFVNQIKKDQSAIKVFVQQKICCSQSYRIINRGFFNYFIQYSLQILPSQILINPSKNNKSQQAKESQDRKNKNYIKYLQQIYKQLSHSQLKINSFLKSDQFISKINSYIQNIIKIKQKKYQCQQQKQTQNYNSQQQLFKDKQNLTKSTYQKLKKTKVTHKNKSQLISIKPIQQRILQKFSTKKIQKKSLKNKNYTQTNFDQFFQSKIQKHQLRNSLNSLQQIQNNKLQKYNGFISVDSLSNKANLSQILPLLKKRNRQQSLTLNKQNRIPEEQIIQCHITQAQKPQFTQQDIKNIYHSLQNAYKIGQSRIKNCKNQLSLIEQQQLLHPRQLNYLKQFFTRLANIHLNNKQAYQNIKMFLICPYDYVVSQMAKLNIIKSYSSPNAMRQSVKKIIILHRLCTTKGQICKHLKYLLGKIAYLQRSMQRQ